MPPAKSKPLTAKERQKKWREKKKSDPEAHERYLQAERERYTRRKAAGTRKMIDDMTPREKRKQRKQWNLHQRNHRQQLKTYASLLTPPGSPDSEHQPAQSSNTNKVRGRKQIRRDRAKAYRKIEHLTVKLQQAQKSTKRVQKRYERAVKKMNDIDTGTPNSKSKRILDYGNRKKIQKCLTFSLSLAKSIRERYQTLRTQREKKLVRTVFCNSYLKKYRLIKYSSTLLGVPLNTLKSPQFQRKRRRDRHSDHTIKAIQDFFLRDDNSSMRPGKKDTITHAKEKIQKRLLCDTMLNLHHKFVYENPKLKVSYVFFCRQKPFWVVRPTIADRDTCKCRTHENIQLMADRLYSLKMITERDPEKLLSSICCSVKCCECMYRECAECKDSRLKYEKYNPTETTWWYEWRVVDHDYKNHTTGKIETTKKTVKVRAEGPLDHLADIFQESLGRKLGRHVFNIRHQFEQLHQKKLSLGNNEMMFHIDFSENYSLKYHSEIQSVHFGASNAQVTLHTGMLYTKSNSMAFASVSDCRRHDASAIWAHMKPVFYHISKKHPEIDTVYFISDGPTTQYRCKKNFYLLSTLPFEWNMKHVNWSFLEAGHGKGAADGVGGVLKRTADRLVAEGNDLADAKSVFNTLSKNTNVTLFYVTEEDVKQIDEFVMPIMLRPIRGTMAFHQLISNERAKVHCRRLSCFCNGEHLCHCFKSLFHEFPESRKELIKNDTNRPSSDTSTPETQSGATPETLSDTVDKSTPMSTENISLYSTNAEANVPAPKLHPVYVFNENLIGKFCIVLYDKKGFPSLIEDADEESVRVNSMCRAGPNRFFWPSRADNDIWYEYTDVVTLIPEPKHVTGRHFQVEPEIWEAVQSNLDDWIR